MSRPFDIVVTLVVVGLFGVGLWSQNTEELAAVALRDTDDVLRLVQAEDLLAGQAWGDLTQHRFGPGNGVPMHWTRHLDLLVAPGVALWGPTATAIAVPLVLLTAFTLVLVAWWGAGPERPDRFLLLLAILPTGLVLDQFTPGRLDHHGLQIVVVVGGALLLVRGAWVWGGALVGSALAVGVDALPAAAGLLVALGVGWVVAPDRWGAALRRTPIAMLVAAAAGSLALAPDGRLWSTLCDVFSLPVAAGLGVAAAGCAWVGARPATTASGRLAQMAMVGVAALATVALVNPACLAGPLADVPPDLTERWLANVSEARSLAGYAADHPLAALGLVMGPLVGAWLVVAAMRHGDHRWLPLLGLLAGAGAVVVLQIRGSSMATALALPALGLLLVRIRQRPWPLARLTTPLMVVTSLLVATGFLPMLADAVLQERDGGTGGMSVKDCTGRERLSTLAAEDPGVVLANLDLGPSILFHTDHSAIAGPYHRNVDGIRLAFDLLDAPTAGPDLAAAGVDLVVVCPGQAGNGLYTTTGDTSLMARLLAGDDVDGLVAVAGDGHLQVWRVTAQP